MSKSQRSSRFTAIRFAFAAIVCGLFFTAASFHTGAAEFSFIHLVGEVFGLRISNTVKGAGMEVSGSNLFQIPEPTITPITQNADRAEKKRRLMNVRGSKAHVSIPTAPQAPSANAIRTLAGCTSNTLPANDDESTGPVVLPFTINYFGRRYTQTFVNNNGNITFNEPLEDFSPFPLNTTNIPIIAPFFADVDTTRPGSGLVQYGNTTLNSQNGVLRQLGQCRLLCLRPLRPLEPRSVQFVSTHPDRSFRHRPG